MSRMEVLHRLWEDKNERRAPLADAFIAAAARQEGAVLVHKDSGFQAISCLSEEWLG